MALHTLGTTSTTAVQCSSAWLQYPLQGTTGAFTAADLAALDQAITDDGSFGVIGVGGGSGVSFGVQNVLTTATTNGTTGLASVTSASGPPVTQIQVGDVVLGATIPLGTFVTVVAAGGATITMSQAATNSASGQRIAFVRLAQSVGESQGGLSAGGQLVIPNRGVVKVMPGDVVAVDNTGWPILVSQRSIAYTGSLWTFT
jgi:hypothetical protein